MEDTNSSPTTPFEDEQSDVGDDTANNETLPDEEQPSEETQPQDGVQTPPPAEATAYSLFSNPPNLAAMRRELFDIKDTIELSPADLETYWPYVDNIWQKCRTGAPQKEENITTEWYWCRLRRSSSQKYSTPKPTPEGKRTRKKRMREEVTCPMGLKIVHTSGVEKSCKVVRAVAGEVAHTHDIDYLDGLKRNSAIMDTARREAVKGFLPASIFAKLWNEPDKMNEAGGKFMKVSDVRNVQYHWRQENQSVVLKAHDGCRATRSDRGRRQRVLDAPKPPHASDPSSNAAIAATLMKLPQDTLRYPMHAREFLEPYLPPLDRPSSVRSSPHVTLAYASSLDSRISLAPGTQTVLSGPESKAMTHYLRSRHDAILIGVRTAIADDPSLNCRLEGAGGYGGTGWTHHPRPIIIDPHAKLHIRPDMKMLKVVSEGRARAPWIVVAPGAMLHPVAVSTLKQYGGEYLMVHEYQAEGPGLSWEGVFGILYNEGIKSIMVEGGGMVLSELLKASYAHLIDSIVVTIAPTCLGRNGVSVSPESRVDEHGNPLAIRFRDVKWQPMGAEDVIMCGKIRDEGPVNGILPGIEEFTQDVSRHALAEMSRRNGDMQTNITMGGLERDRGSPERERRESAAHGDNQGQS